MNIRRPLLILALVLLGGCVSDAPQLRMTLAGGQKVYVDLVHGSVIGESSTEVRPNTASLMADAAKKQGRYLFGANILTTVPLKSVTVEDVSDEKALTLVDDRDPKMTGKEWLFPTDYINADDPRLVWALNLDESFRVYRYTFFFSDGHQVRMHHVAYYPYFVKAKMRKDLGAPD